MLRGGDALLEVRGLCKRFGGTEALRAVDFSVRRGEIHALLGANGAGKSTLIKILAGVHPPDGGEIRLGGGSSRDRQLVRRRISFVHQDLGLIETMSVGENMAMGYGYPLRWQFIDWQAVNRVAAQALDFLGSPLPLDRPVAELSRAEKSIVAIARALVGNVDLLVLDEPTASLPEADVGRLFDVLCTAARAQRRRHLRHPPSRRGLPHRRRGDGAPRRAHGRRLPAARHLAGAARHRHRRPAPLALLTSRKKREGGAGARGRRASRRAGRAGRFPCRRGRDRRACRAARAGPRGRRPRDRRRAAARGGRRPHRRRGSEDRCAGGSDRRRARLRHRQAGRGGARRDDDGQGEPLPQPAEFRPKSFRLQEPRQGAGGRRRHPREFDVRPADPERDIATLSGGNQQKVVLARWAGRRYGCWSSKTRRSASMSAPRRRSTG